LVKKESDPGSGSATLKKKDCVQEENECESILVALGWTWTWIKIFPSLISVLGFRIQKQQKEGGPGGG
jgi:hypothetical protein